MFDTRKLLTTTRRASSEPNLIQDALRGPARTLAPAERVDFERRVAQGPELTQAPRATPPGALSLSRPSDAAEREADAFATRTPSGDVPGRQRAARGVDLGAVRIHSDEISARAARSVGAAAFTVGHDVVVDRGKYEPGTPRGEELIVHELAHVAQQGRSPSTGGGLALQRRTGSYPQEPDSDEYSVLKPKRLNPKGPFSANVLHLISWSYTDASQTGNRRSAELILEMLESSPTFVAMVKALDKHYADDSKPDIWIGYEFRGSMFVPRGQPYPTKTHLGFNTNPSVDVTAIANDDFIMIDPSSRPTISYPATTSSAGPDEQRAVAFADVLIHETTHAFRHVAGLAKGGLKGSLNEELATRLATRSVLREIEKATKNPDIASEAHDAADAVTASGVTLLDVAQSLVSGDGVTYLEKFHLDEAMSVLLPRFAPESTGVERALRGLWPPTSATLKRMPEIRSDFSNALVELSTPKPAPPPAPTVAPSPPVTTTAPTGTATKTPPVKVPPPKAPPAKKVPPPWLLGARDKAKLESLMTDKLTLADLVTAEAVARKVKGDEERALYYYALIARQREIAVTLADEHEKATAVRGSKAYSKLCTELALRLLGIKNAYGGL